ncbi:hypothetical protein J5Y04_06605 [Kitasatospora sp. RG8]|uniref:hypothetical protein n=1 Tax=Kitasatospora sp. RG8 TaxID=2820815 RepID=UPI001ADF2B6D|nr:hypothetical protein [Kitasatospora sp. RG8]MBP0449218.1 hypothetical protein [Kitasatospora sp. RG8]
MRRRIPTAVAASAAALAVLTGCSGTGGSSPAAAPDAFDPAQAVTKAGKDPYAVSVAVTGGPSGTSLTARQNLNTVYTGHREQKAPDGSTLEFVDTADAEYVRGHDATGKWLRTPRPAGPAQIDFTGFTPLLLAQGPAARKGMEHRDGVPVFHLSGHLDLEQGAGVLPALYQTLKSKGVPGFDLDQWIDAQGRTRYVEQGVVLDGARTVVRYVFSDFGPAETFAAPDTNVA